MPFYAVALGREIGVFDSWESCKKSTTQFRGAKFKKFEHMNDAWNFVKQNQPVYSAKDLSYDPISIESERSAKLDHVEVSERSGSSRQSNNSNSEGTKTTGSVSSTVYQKTSGSYSMSATKRKLCDSAIQIFTPGPSRAFSSSSSKRCKTEDGSSSSLSVSSASAPPFKTDADGFVQVYTDGACSNNGCSDGSAKAGIGVWFNDGHPLNVSAPVTGRATNNVAELQAATVAVQMASGAGLKKLSIATDSQFTINCMTQWIQSWKRKNWKTSTGSAVINKEEVLALEKACKSLDEVKWVYTRGHIGIHGNEQADMLARNGASSYNVLEK